MKRRQIPLASLLLGCASFACVSRPPASDPPDLARAAAPQSSLVGVWDLTSIPPPRPSARGFQISIAVDSVIDDVAFGRLAHFMSGDVGIDANRFSRFDGAVQDDSVVAFTISSADEPPAALSVAGNLRGDTIDVATFVLGPDTLSGGARRWLLVRQQ